MSTDAELVDAWRRGEREACAQLFERYYDGLARFFRSKLPEAADDLVQRTFLRCFEGLARIADATAFRSYLFGIACNVLREHYRSIHRDGARLEFTSVSAQELAPSASAVIGWQQEQRLLLEALRRIPLEDQILLELCYWEQLPGREIAAIVGAPLGHDSRVSRQRRALARHAAPRPPLLALLAERTTSSARPPARCEGENRPTSSTAPYAARARAEIGGSTT